MAAPATAPHKNGVAANLQGPGALQVLARSCIPVLLPSRARRRPTCAMSLPLVGGAGDVAAVSPAHLPTRKLGKHGGVGLAGDQGVEHVAPGLAHHVGRDAVELDPCVFERLVQAIDLAGALLDLCLAVSSEVAQLADRLGRHETGPQQARLGRLTKPRRVGDIGLAARDLPDVARVDQQAIEFVLEDRPRRLPVHATGLHDHLLHAVAGEPVAQRQQPPNRGRELSHVLLAPTPLARHPHARRHLRLVDVQRRRALDNRLHLASSQITRLHQTAQGASRTNESGRRARSTLRRPGETPHAKLKTGSQAPRQKIGVTGSAPHHPLFSSTGSVREADRATQGSRRGGLIAIAE
jgi:hypothetical protein